MILFRQAWCEVLVEDDIEKIDMGNNIGDIIDNIGSIDDVNIPPLPLLRKKRISPLIPSTPSSSSSSSSSTHPTSTSSSSTSSSSSSSPSPSSWIHVDPCEAAVNENFIYESWGKQQNYIVSVSKSELRDVTAQYTTKFNETVIRRLKSEINQDFIDEQLLAAQDEIINFKPTIA